MWLDARLRKKSILHKARFCFVYVRAIKSSLFNDLENVENLGLSDVFLRVKWKIFVCALWTILNIEPDWTSPISNSCIFLIKTITFLSALEV